MKRYGKLWEKICSHENLLKAHKKAREDKSFYKEVKMVNADPDYYIEEIRNMLINKTYKVTAEDYEVSIIHDRTKERELRKLQYYPHRIIQWAVMLQLEKIFMKSFCDHTCASIKDRGGAQVARLMSKYRKKPDQFKYCLKLDISKFYPNINHAILKKLLRKKFKDADLMELLDMIIDSHPTEIGLPIGSYLSQFLANFYLCYFDHYVKEQLGVKMVIRYMDDIVIFASTKERLRDIFSKIQDYLTNVLKLKIKENWQIFPTNIRGCDFVGYRYFNDYILLRKSTCNKFKRRAKRIREKQEKKQLINYSEFCSINSYAGWIAWCDGWRLFQTYIAPIIPSMVKYYKTIICKGKPDAERRTEHYETKLSNMQYKRKPKPRKRMDSVKGAMKHG